MDHESAKGLVIPHGLDLPTTLCRRIDEALRGFGACFSVRLGEKVQVEGRTRRQVLSHKRASARPEESATRR